MRWLYLKLVIIIILGAVAANLLYALIFKISVEKLPAVHVPVALAGSKLFYADDFKAIYTAFIQKEKLSKEDALKLIKNSYLEQSLIENVAKKNNISPIALSDAKALFIQDESVKAEKLSNELYNWSLVDFQRLVIQPLELKRGVANWYYEKYNNSIKARLEKVKKDLTTPADIANLPEYTYLGFVDLKSLPPVMQISLLNLAPNSLSEVVETTDSYNIIYLQSNMADSNLFEISVLSYKKNSFSAWLSESVKDLWYLSIVK